MQIPTFSLVIPCYNESLSLVDLIPRVQFLAERGEGEVILVDNGSTDDSQRVLAELLPAHPRVRSVHVPVNEGYGFGISSGLAEARADIVGWTHADLQTDPLDVLRALPAFDGGVDNLFVKGRRHGRPPGDRFFTAGMSLFESALFGMRLNDINAQPTLVHRRLMDVWGTPPKDFSFDLFAMHAAKKNGFRMLRFPVLVSPRRFGTSSWNVDLAAKRRFIRRTVDYSFALRRGR